MKLKNKTSQPQEIHLISGDSILTMSEEIVDVDVSLVYLHELTRASKFFDEIKGGKPIIQKKKKVEDFKNNEEIGGDL